jgi:hypothetical protein
VQTPPSDGEKLNGNVRHPHGAEKSPPLLPAAGPVGLAFSRLLLRLSDRRGNRILIPNSRQSNHAAADGGRHGFTNALLDRLARDGGDDPAWNDADEAGQRTIADNLGRPVG